MSDQEAGAGFNTPTPVLPPSSSAPVGGPSPSLALTPSASNQPAVTPTTTPVDQSSSLVAAHNAAPKLSPAVTVGVAKSAANPADAAVRAQATSAYSEASKMADSLNKTDTDFQYTFWKGASPAIQSLLAATGYKPPTSDTVSPKLQRPGGGGFWHDIGHWAASRADNLRRAGGNVVNYMVLKPVHATTQLFSDAAAPVNQAIRAEGENVINTLGAASGRTGALSRAEGLLPILNPMHIIDNWNSVANGKTSFQPDAVMYVKDYMQVNGKTLQLAQLLASGGTLQQALASVAPDERASAYGLIESNPKFMDAVKLLSDSHLSLGQMLFGGLSPKQIAQVNPGTRVGAIEGVRDASDVSGAAAAAATIASGGAAPGIASAALGIGDTAEGLGLAEGASSLAETATSLRGVTALATGGLLAGGSALAGSGESPDTATQIDPFGLKVNPLSGITDGLVSWYANPLFVGLQARGAYNAAAHSLAILDSQGNAIDVAARYLNQSGERAWAQKLVKAATEPWLPEHEGFAPSVNVSALQRVGISVNAEWVKILQEEYPKLLEAAKSDDEDAVPRAVGTMLGDQQGIINIMRGRLGAAMHDAQQTPHLTIPQRVLDTIKGIGESTFQGKRFNPDALTYRELSLDAFGNPITDDGMALAEATDQKLGHAARFLRRPTNLIPENAVLRFSDPQRIKIFQQLARFGAMSEARIAELTNSYALLGPADEGLQVAAIRGMMNEVLHDANVDRTVDGKAWMDSVLKNMDFSAGDGEMYSDARNPNGPMQEMAIFPSELADAVAIPSYADYYKFAKKTWFMNQLELRLNSDLLDKFMASYWKRAMLLRSGFALRFGGEEALSYIVREGLGSYVKGRVAASLYDTANPTKEAMRAAQEAIAERAQQELMANGGDIKAINSIDVARAWQALASDLPDEVQQAIKTPEQFIASIQGWSAINFLRRAGVSFVGPDMLAGAYNLARRGVLDSAFEDTIDAVRSHGTVYFGDIPKSGDEQALIRHEDGTPLEFRPTGKYLSFTKENAVPAWSYRLNGIAGTDIGRGIARSYAYGGVDAQMQYAKDWIEGTSEQARVSAASEDLDRIAARWDKAGQPADGPIASRLDTAQGELDAAEKSLEEHQRLINKFRVNFQTQSGGTIVNGSATREQIVNDWAQAMVRKVNRLTMTSEGQDFDAEGERIPLAEGPQPIRLSQTVPEKEPWKIKTRDVDREIKEVPSDRVAYHAVPEGQVRLFRAENTTAAHENAPVAGQGKYWTPSYQVASNRAGELGKVYSIDVPKATLKSEYDFHGDADIRDSYIDEAHDAQHASPHAAPTDRGYFESGDIAHMNESHAVQRTLISEIGRGIVPSNIELKRVDEIHVPDELTIPEQMVKQNPGKIDQFLSAGMRQLVGRPANWLSRQPIFTHNYTTALDETVKMLASRGIEDDSGDLAHDIAMERAFNETIPYIHNPASKSQFSIIVRNIAPFWFAQEQFYKRWGRLFGTYPEAFYKLQMTMNGLRSVGFVQKDSYGQDSFVYPGSQAVLSLLARIPFFGSIPVDVGMTGEISQLNPTLTTSGAPIPSFGPIITIPLDIAGVALAHFGVPFVSALAQAAAGPEAPQFNQEGNWAQDTLEQLTPSVLNRFATWAQNQEAGSPTNVTDPIFMSLMIMGAQQLEASGHGLSVADENNPVKVQQYMDRIASWAKSLLFIRTIFGFFAPATPTFKISDGGLGAQLTALMATMPYDAAVTAFIKAHPNATADTIFESTTSGATGSGTYVPATTQALTYMQDNANFFKNYSQLAPYAIPGKASKGLFNGDAYDKEIAMDLRTRRPLYSPDLVGSWYGEVKYSEGANVYYPMETLMQAAGSGTSTQAGAAQATLGITQAQALAQLKIPAGTDVKTLWSTWSTNFKTSHPLFAAQQATEGGISAARRTAIVGQLQDAITKGALPEGQWSTHVSELMAAFDKVQEAYPGVKDTTQATENKQAFLTWGTAFVKVYPSVAPIYNSVISLAVPG